MKRSLGLAVITLGIVFAAEPAGAVVYCKTVGVPKGCVARPAAAPVAAARVVGQPRPGNWNGGVNRVGRRR